MHSLADKRTNGRRWVRHPRLVISFLATAALLTVLGASALMSGASVRLGPSANVVPATLPLLAYGSPTPQMPCGGGSGPCA